MSDEIFDGIFPIVHRTFLLSYFRGCWLSDVFCTQTVCGHTMKRLSSWRRPFFLNDFNSMGMSVVTKLNFWRRKIYKIRLDSFLSLSWFAATVNTTRLLIQIVRKGLREALVRVRSCKCHVFELFLFEHIVRKWQCLLSLFINGPLTME